jgi:hypothetical protein
MQQWQWEDISFHDHHLASTSSSRFRATGLSELTADHATQLTKLNVKM